MIQSFIGFAILSLASQSGHLTPGTPIVVPGGSGKYDFMNVDADNRMAFACHPGKSSFTVINLDAGTVKEVDAGTAVNGIDVDSAGKKLYAAGPGKSLVQFDMTTWTKSNTLSLDGPGDSVIYDAKRGVVYVDNDDGTNLWIVDPATMKLSSAVTIKEAPEVMVLDDARNKIFQNIKTTNTIQVIDAESKKVTGEYTLGDLTGPHGLAEDKASGKLFSVGKNGKLVVLDADSGKILSNVDVVKGSDQIAYDQELKRLYIPGSGVIQVIQVSDTGAVVLDSVPVAKGCHSVTVDPKTHDVWVVYSDDKDSYAMKYTAS
jgi:glutamine cyclotransferase